MAVRVPMDQESKQILKNTYSAQKIRAYRVLRRERNIGLREDAGLGLFLLHFREDLARDHVEIERILRIIEIDGDLRQEMEDFQVLQDEFEQQRRRGPSEEWMNTRMNL